MNSDLPCLNVMIGPNGAGKSNFIGFFRFMSWMLSGNLQRHIGELGYANDILYDGADVTRELTAHIQLSTQQGINEYKFRLVFAAGDTLIFVDEQYRFSNAQYSTHGQWQNLGAGYSEARILDRMADDQTARTIVNLLSRLQVYQFHNTSDTSPMRTRWSTSDSRFLKENGANLGAFLYKLQQEKSDYYLKIVRQVRLILPFFDDFDLYAEKNKVLLRWREKGTIKVFNAAQASDGMLRAIALIALLSQPIVNLPDVLFLDEPELGLHPFAIDLIAGLIKSVSQHRQVFVATQSADLLNNFDAGDVIVVDRPGRVSTYERLKEIELENWLGEYSLSELWEKNVLGGKPA